MVPTALSRRRSPAWLRYALFTLIFAVTSASALAQAAASPAGAPLEALTAERWAKDLDVLAVELPAKHKNLFFKMPEAEFRKSLAALKADLPALGPDEILVRLLRLVASVGDSHTGVDYRAGRGLPLMVYWFRDGLTVVNTTADYEPILFGRITAVDGVAIDAVTSALASVIPHENEAQVRNQAPGLLVDTVLLHGLGLIASAGSARLTVETPSGGTAAAELRPIAFSTRPTWLVGPADESQTPLYLRKRNVPYWFEILPSEKALYFKYNSCREIADRPFPGFVREMFQAADAAAVERLVVDLRHNGGGDSSLFASFLDELRKRPALLRKGRLSVIIGRRTFSSAVLNAVDLRKSTPAVFFGEPTGGKPNHYGELQSFRLPESGLGVTYSIQYFRVVEGDPASILPDTAVELTLADYLAKADPVLDAALGRRR